MIDRTSVANCSQPIQKVEWNPMEVQILQKVRTFDVTITRCYIRRKRMAWYCGMHSHMR